jgi:hypothetical protein
VRCPTAALQNAAQRGSILGVVRPPLHGSARPLAVASVVALGGLFPSPVGARPRTTDAELKAAGIELSWSVAAPSARVLPSSRIVVRVRGKRPRARKRVSVRVVRLSKRGKPLRVVKARRLKAGRVTFRLPKQNGRRYRVTVKVGGLRSRTLLRTAPLLQPIAEISAPAPVPTPTPAPTAPVATTPPAEDGAAPAVPDPTPVASKCDLSTEVRDPRPPTAILHISTAPAVHGERRSFEVENTSPRCVYGGPGFSWQKQEGPIWIPVPNWPPQFFSPVPISLGPGLRWTGTVAVPSIATPGHYRVIVGWVAASTLSAELDVIG